MAPFELKKNRFGYKIGRKLKRYRNKGTIVRKPAGMNKSKHPR
jgi:hypothetical protein